MSLISFREILRFYLPLLLTSQMMTLSGPLINVAVGRSADPTLEFAGYWIGFSILMFIESPCLITQQLTATLATGYRSLKTLFAVAFAVGLTASLTALLVALTPLRDLVFLDLIHTTPRVADRASEVLRLLAPVPILIALRGVGNGIAIREKRTGLIARATGARVLVLATVVGFVVVLKTGSGALAGAAALLAGLAVEMVLVLIAVSPFILERRRARAEDREHLAYSEIFRVALPLSVAAYVWTVSRPVVNAILGRLPDPELAQAGFGVVAPIVLLTCSPLWALQNVSLILPETRRDLARVLRFSALMAMIFSVTILILVTTPLRDLLLRMGFALSPQMEATIAPALLLIVFEPYFLSVRSIAQGLLMKAKKTGVIGSVSVLKLAVITTVGIAIVQRYPGVNGVILGTALFIGGDLVDGLFCGLGARSVVLGGHVFEKPFRAGAEPVPIDD